MKPILLFTLLLNFAVYSQNYDVQLIPEDLKKDANVVIREQSTQYIINSISDMEIKHLGAITIMNKEGDDYNKIYIPYDKSSKVSDIKVLVYNTQGKEIKSYKKSDFSDFSYTPSYGLYVDDRILVLKVEEPDYPYTLKYSYTTNTSNTIFINDLVPVHTFKTSVEKKMVKIDNRSGIKLRHKVSNNDFGKVTIQENGNLSEFSYQNFKALNDEKWTPSLSTLVPKVQFALEKFNLMGEQGTLSNWEEFGKWYYDKLLTPTTTITPEIKAEVDALNLTGSNPEKVKKIYQYMQNKTRYVLVSMGIGGWMPMKADDVRKKGYGDCKALTNYMRALLTAAEIPSYYALIKNDNSVETFDADFPKMGGNHAILMIPDGKNNIWLENTNQKIAYNHIGIGNMNRNVLAVSNKGISIIDTPVYPADKSKETIKSKIKIKEDNSVDVISDFEFSGGQYDFNLSLADLPNSKIEERLKERYDNLKISDFEVKDFFNNRDHATISYKMNFKANDFSKKIGEDYLLRVVPFYDYSMNTSDTERTLPFENNFAYQDDYEMEFEAPQGYQFSEIPKPLNIDSEFGKYEIKYNINENKLLVHRILTIYKGVYPKEKFKEYMNFRRKTINSDNAKVLISKK